MLNPATNNTLITPVGNVSTSLSSAERMSALTNAELALVDPVEINLLVAKGIPSLADLNIHHYQELADTWAEDIRRHLDSAEDEFHKTPQYWKNDIRFFRLGMICWYLDEVLDIRYHEDQRNLNHVLYTDPSDLFLNGVMDTRRGTCGNMAMLHVALGWRMGWPVSLACVGSHFICRYDDGEVIHNIEATNNGNGGFHSHPDELYLREHDLPMIARRCGSDLRAVTPREMLGLTFGLHARHFENTNFLEQAEADYLLARSLFPTNRHLYVTQNQASVQCSMDRFEPGEKGHPTELADWLQEVVRLGPWNGDRFPQPSQERIHENDIDKIFVNWPDGLAEL